jgi:hypothetical protein
VPKFAQRAVPAVPGDREQHGRAVSSGRSHR